MTRWHMYCTHLSFSEAMCFLLVPSRWTVNNVQPIWNQKQVKAS